jgi:hypothetical protein
MVVNDDWRRAVDELEGELLSCAVQVLDCIDRQRVGLMRSDEEGL